MNKKYIVNLTQEEREQLTALVSKGKAAAYKIKHAHILLLADTNGQAWSDESIAKALSVHPNTVRGVRQRWVEQGLEAAIARKAQSCPSRPALLDGNQEAQLIALRCSAPPPGYARWTLHLLADKFVELQVVESISHETVRKVLKKTHSSRIYANATAFPPSRAQRL
jgi:transposase